MKENLALQYAKDIQLVLDLWEINSETSYLRKKYCKKMKKVVDKQ